MKSIHLKMIASFLLVAVGMVIGIFYKPSFSQKPPQIYNKPNQNLENEGNEKLPNKDNDSVLNITEEKEQDVPHVVHGEEIFYSAGPLLEEARRIAFEGKYTTAYQLVEKGFKVFKETFEEPAYHAAYWDFKKLWNIETYRESRDFDEIMQLLEYSESNYFKNDELYLLGLMKLPAGFFQFIMLSKDSDYPPIPKPVRVTLIENDVENKKIQEEINAMQRVDQQTGKIVESREVVTYLVDIEGKGYNIYLSKQEAGGIKPYAIKAVPD